MKKTILLALFVLLGVGVANAQLRVTGKVTHAESGEALPFVTVAVKGSTVTTLTGNDGTYAINVPDGYNVLSFSSTEFATVEKEINGLTTIDADMIESATLLTEAMVVAYGTATRSAFTGSAGVLKSESIAKTQTSNPVNALGGKVAGVQMTSTTGQPGTTPSVKIRGTGSMSASNAPLYVVDGVPFDGDVSSINPRDIESMTVLKDAASNALYGARGANGVILITTKRGQSGEAVINVDAKWGSNSRGVPQYDVMTDPNQYYEKVYEAMYNGIHLSLGYPEAFTHNYINANIYGNADGGVGYRIHSYPVGEDLFAVGGTINPNATLGYSDGTYYYYPDSWYDELFNSGNLRQEYNISVSGSSDKINYYASGGYLDDAGIAPGSGFTRYTARTNVEYQAKKWLRIGTNIAYTNYISKSPGSQTASGNSGNLFYVANMMAPIYPMYVRNADGSIKIDDRGFTVYDFGDRTSTNFTRTFMNMSNPASTLQLDKTQYAASVFSGKAFGVIDIVEGLRARITFGYDIDDTKYRRLYNAYYGQFAAEKGLVSMAADRTVGMTHQYLLTYAKTFGLHNFDVMAGYEQYNNKIENFSGSKKKLYNPTVVEINNAILDPQVSSSSGRYATQGVFGRAQYDYRGEFFASASVRGDASSRFHKDNRWGAFWSVGGAWLMTKNLLTDVTWLDMLKVKASYGQQGNDALMYSNGTGNLYPYADQYSLSELNGEYALVMTYKGNKDITWETSHSFNVGADFDMFKGKLSGSLEYFSRKTSDMLYFLPVAPSIGYSSYPMNVGSVRNNGFEVELNSNIITTEDLSWNVYLNATHVKNKIISLEESLGGEWVSGSYLYKEGGSMYNFYMPKYAGVDETTGESLWLKDLKDASGNIIGTDVTNLYAEATRYETGDILPDVYGGFGTSVEFMGFDFSIDFQYQLGGRMYDNTYAALMHSGTSDEAGTNWHKDIQNSWTPSNTSTNIPKVDAMSQNQNSLSDRFLTNSNYLSLSNITFGYTLPKSLTRKLYIDGIRVYFVADNVALLTKRKGLDPRQSFTAGGSYMYSAIRSISGGISLTF